MSKVSNKTLRYYDGREGRNESYEDERSLCHDDRVLGNHNHDNRSRDDVSFETQAKDKPRMKLVQTYTRENTQATINSNKENNKHDITTGRNKGTQPGSDRTVKKHSLGNKLADSSYYQIIIPDRHKYRKDYIIDNLQNYVAPETLVPIKYRKNGNGANFFVDDKKVAVALLDCEITTSQRHKLTVEVTRPPIPHCKIDKVFKESVKQAIMKRYVPAIKMIDLSRFHRDPHLISDYFCALSCPSVLDTIFDVLLENMPDIIAINLNKNILNIDVTLRVIKVKLLKLKVLHIGDNSIKTIEEIDAIKDLELEELILAGNPICNEYQSPNDYIKDVQKRCPTLQRLDGMNLPKIISSDTVEEGNTMPASQRMFAPNSQTQQIASLFLQQYFIIFDSEDREPLLTAYTTDAYFSMTVFDPRNPNKLNGYNMDNRNFYRINSTDKTQQLVKQGRWPIVAFLYQMSRTSHYVNTLTMDISLITEAMMLVTITGMFRVLDEEEQPIRYFNRTFTIIPEGTGYCIKNEQLHITQPTKAQLKQLNSEPKVQQTDTTEQMLDLIDLDVEMMDPEAQMTNLQKQTSPVNSSTELLPVQLTEAVKQQMTMTLSQQTGMNLQWSLKCLLELSWNYDDAFSAFQTFQEQGQIPVEAFIN